MGRDQWAGSGPRGEEVRVGAEPSAQLKGKGQATGRGRAQEFYL